MPLNKKAGMTMEKQALSAVARMAIKQLLKSTGVGGAIGGVGGGLYGAFRGKRPGESRLGAVGRSALSGAGWGAGLSGGIGGGLMASKAGRGLLAAMYGRSRMLKGLAGKYGGYLNIPRDIVVNRSFEPVNRAMGDLALNPLMGVSLPAATGAAGMLGLGGMMSRATEPEESHAKRAYHKRQAFALGQRLAMRKRADDLTPIQQSMLGLAGGGLAGALLGPMTTMREEMRAKEYGTRDEQRKLKLKRQLRALLFGGVGAIAGGMLPGLLNPEGKGRLSAGLHSLGRGVGGYGTVLKKLLKPLSDPLAEGYNSAPGMS